MLRYKRMLIPLLALAVVLPTCWTGPMSHAADNLQGTIRISLTGNDQDVWQQVAAAYELLHPGVKVVVDLKPQDGYPDYINAGFAAGTPPFDLVNTNQNASLVIAGKFLDLSPYFGRPDPYIGGKPWKDAIDLTSMVADQSGAHIYNLDLEAVKVLWFYNKDIFAKVGITSTPKTWSDLLADAAKIKKAGYIPLALAGDASDQWSGPVSFLPWIYYDQYTRSLFNDERSQPGDYTYDKSIDPKWHYNPSNPYNDDPNSITINPLRRLIAIQKSFTDTPEQAKMDRWRADSLPMQALAQNLHDLLANDTPPGWLGINQDSAYALFLRQKAAIIPTDSSLLTSFDKDLNNLKSTKSFTLGTFDFPSMTGPYVQAPARTIEVPIDFYGVPNKSFTQNNLNVDFLMWFSSPAGYSIYMKDEISSPHGSLVGPPLVRNVKLPASVRDRFSQLKFIGNVQKPGAAGVGARGFDDFQPSVRDWSSLTQQYYANKLSTAQFAAAHQKDLSDNFSGVLSFFKLRASDLTTPAKQPPTRQ
jgi:raffinose/stachyose/melibiose transport system substrate-binding protein